MILVAKVRRSLHAYNWLGCMNIPLLCLVPAYMNENHLGVDGILSRTAHLILKSARGSPPWRCRVWPSVGRLENDVR